MSLEVEWDAKKAAANLAKHKVSFEEGITVFADPLARIFNDDEWWRRLLRYILNPPSKIGESRAAETRDARFKRKAAERAARQRF